MKKISFTNSLVYIISELFTEFKEKDIKIDKYYDQKKIHYLIE